WVVARVDDRGFPLAAHDLLSLQRVHQLLRVRTITVADPFQRAEPEDLANDGGVLEQELLLDRKRVESGGDDPLHGLRKPEPTSVLAQLVDHARELLGVEWVATGALDQHRL